MWRKLTNTEIEQIIDKIKKKYGSLIKDFNKPKTLISSFEERYFKTLKESKDLSVFLLAEIEAVEELYKTEENKREIEKQKKHNKEEKSFADKVFESNRKKIEKYPKIELSFDAGEELERFIGAIRNFLINYWPAINTIFNNDLNSTLKSLFGEFHYQLLIKYDYKNDPPITRSYSNILKIIPVNQKKLDFEYYYILKETAFLLNEICDALKSVLKENRVPNADLKLSIPDLDQKDWYNNYFKNLSNKECIEKVFNYISDVITDFRIKDIRKK